MAFLLWLQDHFLYSTSLEAARRMGEYLPLFHASSESFVLQLWVYQSYDMQHYVQHWHKAIISNQVESRCLKISSMRFAWGIGLWHEKIVGTENKFKFYISLPVSWMYEMWHGFFFFFFLIPKGPLCICVNSISIYMYKGDLGNMLTFAFILILRPNFH